MLRTDRFDSAASPGTALRWRPLLLVALLVSLAVGTAAPRAAAGSDAASTVGWAAPQDITNRVLALPGMSLVSERSTGAHHWLVLNYRQPVDHRNPGMGSFQQRLTLLHRDTSRPTVFSTTGYGISTLPYRSEPAQIIDGNEVSLEHRFFVPSRPRPADWAKLDIWQAASDQHRVFAALRSIYGRRWLSTGASKGGMTATYFERFYPADMDGVIAYVAPNDAIDDEDSAYDAFLASVGTKTCRDRLNAVQREALVRRAPLQKLFRARLTATGETVDTVGSLDRAYEAAVLDYVWMFWQYQHSNWCVTVPTAATATDRELYGAIDETVGFESYTDQGLARYLPYYYQAGTQLGAPDITQPHLAGLSRYGYPRPRAFVPRTIPMTFQPTAMRDIDQWVHRNAQNMLFVYGQNDPWGAERFRLGSSARDSYVLTAPGANHGANISALPSAQRAKATARVLAWAGVGSPAVLRSPSGAQPLAAFDSELDTRRAGATLRP